MKPSHQQSPSSVLGPAVFFYVNLGGTLWEITTSTGTTGTLNF